MSKKRAIWIELVAFVLLLSITTSHIYGILRYKNTGSGGGMDNFYDTEVPIDVIVFGSSHAACTVNNALLWEENGIASYTLTAGAQYGDGTLFFVKEALAKKKPKVALVETYLLLNEGFVLDSFYRSGLTARFSGRYLDYVNSVVRDNGLDRDFWENAVLRMPIVHSRYKELTRDDFVRTEGYNRGYRGSIEVSSFDPLELSDEVADLDEDILSRVDDIIEVCDKNEVDVVFFAAPYCATKEQQMVQNSLREYVEGKGGKYLDYLQNYQSLGIDFSEDFRDYEHLNDYGAEKITRAIGTTLLSDYAIPDRRGQKGFEQWDQHVSFLVDRQLGYSLQECYDVTSYLSLLAQNLPEYSIVLSLNGNYRAIGDDLFMPFLSECGISVEDYEKGGVYVIHGGAVNYYSQGENEYCHHQKIGDLDLVLNKAGNDDFARIRLGEDDYSPDCNGINVVIVDEEIGYLVDAMHVDVYSGPEVIHDVNDL